MNNLDHIVNTHTESLKQRNFSVYRGWSNELAKQLVQNSCDDTMKRFVPRDAAERFRDEKAAEFWYSQNARVVYALAKQATLGGVIWFTQRLIHELPADATFAIRMYNLARGQRLAGDFMAAVHSDFFERHPNSRGIWLKTDEDNFVALKLYNDQGYRQVGAPRNGRVLMVKSNTG